MSADPKHPMQPIVLDHNWTARFKVNPIVLYLLDNGRFDLNDIAERAQKESCRLPFKDCGLFDGEDITCCESCSHLRVNT